jgi:hypothetical protein
MPCGTITCLQSQIGSVGHLGWSRSAQVEDVGVARGCPLGTGQDRYEGTVVARLMRTTFVGLTA